MTILDRRISRKPIARGPAGLQGPIPDHEIDGPLIRFQLPDGSFGPWINTLGPEGPSGDAQNFATRSVAAAATISAGVEVIRTGGFITAGDGLGREYYRVGSEGAAGEAGFSSNGGTVWWRPIFGWREPIEAALPIYVRVDGDDDNSGRVDSSGGAKRSIQEAIYEAMLIDTYRNDINIFVGPGSGSSDYVLPATMNGPLFGGGTLNIIGDTGTPGNNFANVTGSAFSFQNGAKATLSGFKVAASVNGIELSAYSDVVLTSIHYGSCPGMCIQTDLYSRCRHHGGFTILGGTTSGGWVHAVNSSHFETDASLCTMPNTPASPIMNAFFAGMSENSTVKLLLTYSGTITGRRLYRHQGAILQTTGGAEMNPDVILPGSIASIDVGDGSVNDGHGAVYDKTVATLPSATGAMAGHRFFVTDATATTFHSIVAGGGANKVPVWSDGTNWRIG